MIQFQVPIALKDTILAYEHMGMVRHECEDETMVELHCPTILGMGRYTFRSSY